MQMHFENTYPNFMQAGASKFRIQRNVWNRRSSGFYGSVHLYLVMILKHRILHH